MKYASVNDVMKFYIKYYQDTTCALWSSVVTVLRRTPDLGFFGDSTWVINCSVMRIVCWWLHTYLSLYIVHSPTNALSIKLGKV